MVSPTVAEPVLRSGEGKSMKTNKRGWAIYPNPHSNFEGGGNAPNSCFPTAKTREEEYDYDDERGWAAEVGVIYVGFCCRTVDGDKNTNAANMCMNTRSKVASRVKASSTCTRSLMYVVP